MPDVAGALGRALNLRPGEGRTVVVMGGFLLLVTATTTVLSATTSGLFLSVYPGAYIPHVIIGAAVVSAAASIFFSGIIAGTARRSLAGRLTGVVVGALLASRVAYQVNPRWSLGVYLLLSAVQVLMVSHAWDYASDLLTGRQARRLSPLLGAGASVGTLVGGISVPFVVSRVGTENLLLIATFFVAASLPLLWAIPEPAAPADETPVAATGSLRRFVAGAGRGLRGIGSEPLLTVMAATAVCLAVAGTLIELQFKTALQAGMGKDQITAVLGIMSGVVGMGTLLAQLAASRWLFPRLGVSFAAKLHAGLLTVAALGAAVTGGVWVLAALQAAREILQSSTQEPVEQVSLFPFPGPLKSASLATLSGVIRPLSEAGAGVLAILLASRSSVMPVLTAAAAAAAFLVVMRHHRHYMDALVRALTRHTVEFTSTMDTPLVVDREALAVIDRGLEDRDPTVVIFSVALLAQLPSGVAVPRVTAQLGHPIPEVRAEAARVLARLDLSIEERPAAELRAAVDRETSRFALASLLDTLGGWGQADPEHLVPIARSGDPQVRRAALVALGRSGWEGTGAEMARLLASDAPWEDRVVGAGAVGALGAVEHLDGVARAVEDPASRPTALEALSALGAPAVPVLLSLLERRDLRLPTRRTLVTALAAVAHRDGQAALVAVAHEPALGPAALMSLHRLRRERRMEPVEPSRLRSPLQAEVRRGLRCALASSVLRRAEGDAHIAFLAEELSGLAERSFQRVLRTLALSHDPARMASIHEALASRDASQRSNALELLEGMLAPEDARIVMPYADAVTEEYAEDRVAALVADAEALRARPLDALSDDPDWWIRSLALHGLGRDREITIPGRDPDDTEDPDMIPIIERVMILKGSQLFRDLPGQDLAGIASLAEVVYLDDGDTVFRQGDAGDSFFMVVQGGIRIVRGSHELAILGPREGFGEMAILDQETRSATAIAAEPTTLLRIDRDSFDRLIEQNPSVARGIYRVLTQRLRNTLAQLATG